MSEWMRTITISTLITHDRRGYLLSPRCYTITNPRVTIIRAAVCISNDNALDRWR